MKVCMTAFEPFDGRDTNQSLQILNGYQNEDLSIQIDKYILPVTYDNETIKSLLPSFHKYDLILLNGEAINREKITLEQYAYNEKKSKTVDNQGVLFSGEVISLEGKDSVETIYPIKKFIKEHQFSFINPSSDPGRFICNYVYYLVLNEVVDKPVLFIHYPDLKKQGIKEEEVYFFLTQIINYI